MANRGMGRGLAAILSVSEPSDTDELRDLPVDLITPNPHQPRRAFDETALESLATSITENGVLQPVLVRPLAGGTYELVAGERRWRAARLAGLERLPALVRDRDDATSLELALVENMAREDLNPVEEARACAALVEELGLTREEVGRRVGRSRVAVSNLLRLLDLPDDAITMLENGELTEGHGRALLLAADHAAQAQARPHRGRRGLVGPDARSGRARRQRPSGPERRDDQAHDPPPRPGGGHRHHRRDPRRRAGQGGPSEARRHRLQSRAGAVDDGGSSRARGPPEASRRRYTRQPPGRLAQPVRALL